MGSLFGVAVSPFELAEWQDATGISPDMCMVFEAWSNNRTLEATTAKAQELGHDSLVVTWEPWQPTPLGLTNEEQGAYQAQYSAASILSGQHNDYIDANARVLRDSGLTVYLRFAHEMNGNWYPWYHDPVGYVAAWKYVRQRVRSMRGAWNVKMVWSPNPDLWRSTAADWLARLLPYWPGQAAIDYVGFTSIEFGGDKDYSVADFTDRFNLAGQLFQRPVVAPEANVALDKANQWLRDWAAAVTRGTARLPFFVLSQGPSRAEASTTTGDLSWSAMDHPETWDAVKTLANALRQAP